MEVLGRKKVALLYGGQSGEHEVSCRSARFVWEMLSLSYDVVLIGINKKGEWYWQNTQSIKENEIIIQENRLLELRPEHGIFYQNSGLFVDCVFPIIHGTFGEDGRLQALLDMVGIPYVGASFLSSALCMDKGLLKTVWENQRVPTLPFLLLPDYEYKRLSDEELRKKLDFFAGFPFIVKPSAGGSSLGVSKVDSFSALRVALEEAFKWDSYLLIEPFGRFREIECAVVGSGQDVEVYPLGEIIFKGVEFYDYETKYEDKHELHLQVPAEVSPELEQKIKEIARRAYLAGRCEGFARVDFFVSKEDETQIYVNEINTLPGMTKVSLFPKMCLESGISLKDLGKKFIEEGMARRKPSAL